jgi:ATP-dependent Lon protease
MILPIGGLNEKLLAAKRLGIKTVLIPEGNAKDIQEVNPHILKGLNIIPVERLDQALPHAFRKWTATRSDSTPQKHDVQHQEKRKKKNISIAQSTSNKKKSGRVSRS